MTIKGRLPDPKLLRLKVFIANGTYSNGKKWVLYYAGNVMIMEADGKKVEFKLEDMLMETLKVLEGKA